MTLLRGSRSASGCRRASGLWRAPLGVILAFTWVASAAAAQSRLEIDLAGTRIEYDTVAPLDAPSLAALGEWQSSSLFARASASVTGFQDAGWSVQGRGDLAGWLAPFGVPSALRLELGASLNGASHSRGFDSRLARGDARMHVRSGRFGAWAGAALASAKNSFDSASVTGVAPNVGVWMQTRYARGTLAFQHTLVSGDAYPEANVALTVTRGPADVTIYGGARDTPFATTSWSERWAGISAVWWLTPHAALVASGGRYGSDVFQGLPGGDFLSVGLRFTPRRVRPIPITAPAPIVYSADEARLGSIAFAVEGAERVEIAGDWNAWVLEPLTRDASGRWVVPTSIAPGVHRFNLRVDGERWIVPEGVAAVDDGFGGSVGLLIVSAP